MVCVVPVTISGNIVTTASGSAIITISGSVTSVSGSPVTVSGNAVTISGNIVQISGQSVVISSSASIPASVSGSFVTVMGNSFVPVAQDPSIGNPIETVTHPHTDIHDGKHFLTTALDRNLTSGVFIAYYTTTSSQITHMLFSVEGGPAVVKLYENPTITSAVVALTVNCHNRISGTSSFTTCFGPIFLNSGMYTSGTGTLLFTQQLGEIPTTGGAAFNPSRGTLGTDSSERDENEFVLKISGTYLLETFTLSSGPNHVNTQFRWYYQ